MTVRDDYSEMPTRPPLPVEEALELLLARCRPIVDSERVPTGSGLGRVLAESVVSTIDVPGWDNSAMDGYAIRRADLAAGGRLPVSQRIPAGVAGPPLEPGTAARIFTGAPVPTGADTVVIQEACTTDGDWVRVPPDVETGANIRRTGEDIAAGSQAILAGIRLEARHLGLAASVGAAELSVRRRLRVAVFCSGDELVMPGTTPLGPGQIYNSNRFTLIGLLEELGCEVRDLGIVEDTLDATMKTLADAAEHADLILASGGVSVGEEDHVKPAVERLGSLDLWQIAMRPGKPLAFGHIGAARTPFIGSPGNPVSLFVTFCLFARPFIRRMQGIAGSLRPAAVTAAAGFVRPRPAKRREFPRARLEPDADGRLRVSLYPNPSSAVLSSVVWANGLAVIPEGRTLNAGDPIEFIPFSELTG